MTADIAMAVLGALLVVLGVVLLVGVVRQGRKYRAAVLARAGGLLLVVAGLEIAQGWFRPGARGARDIRGWLLLGGVAGLLALAGIVEVAGWHYQDWAFRPGAERPGRRTVVLAWAGRVLAIALCAYMALGGDASILERIFWGVMGALAIGWTVLVEWYRRRVRASAVDAGDD